VTQRAGLAWSTEGLMARNNFRFARHSTGSSPSASADFSVASSISERNTVRNQSVLIGLALEVLAEVRMGDGNERHGALRD
jgi:hypothetical protein